MKSMFQVYREKLSQLPTLGGRYEMTDQRLLFKVMDLVEQHFKQHKGLTFYVDQLNVNLYRINKITRTYLDSTLYQVIQDRIHEEAMKLLRESDLSASQITHELGISDPPYFSRCFKKNTGLTPRQYRRLK